MDNISILWLYIILGICIVAALVGLYVAITLHFKKKTIGNSLGMIASLVIFGVLLLEVGTVVQKAHQTGANYEHYTKMSIKNFNKEYELSYLKKIPKRGQRNIIIVLYRFNCSDCDQIQNDVKNQLPRNNKQIYYVPSRSKLGVKLVRELNIKNVPAIIYISKAGYKMTAPLKDGDEINRPAVNYYLGRIEEK